VRRIILGIFVQDSPSSTMVKKMGERGEKEKNKKIKQKHRQVGILARNLPLRCYFTSCVLPSQI
jgi:hypothetical protein